jgi:type I restriction enzyme, S subunit
MELLEQHFDTAFSAANGIQKLRELILTLAMQGKLVPQHRSDAPASQLLKEIEAEKKRLAKEGKIKAPKPLPEITSSDAPYALPQGWQWVWLGSVGNIFNGNSINASEKEAKYAGAKGLPYIATKDVGYGFDPLDYENGIFIPVGEDKFRLAHEGAVLICAEGGSAGKKCGLTDRDICFGNKLFANELYGQIPSRFILYAYLSPVFRASFAAAMSGIIGGVSIAKFVEIPIPLPPLDEQHRIVAKIDQLMARCDALENLRNEREKRRLATHAAALSQLLDTTSNGSTDDAWAFISQHFGDLYAVKENVAELRKAILQLAVLGKLVPQDPNDPPASQLLKEIQVEKLRLQKAGRIKLPKKLPVIVPNEATPPLPDTWVSCHFQDIFMSLKYGTSKKCDYSGGSIPVLRIPNVSNGKIVLEDIKSTDFSSREASELSLQQNDILMIRSNGSESLVGRSAVVGESAVGFSYAGYLMRIRFLKGLVDSSYVHQVLLCPMTRAAIEGPIRTTSGVKNINSTEVSQLKIPLPPLQEQRRIVAKINQLMELCDTLEQSIATATGKQTELLDALMAQV